MKSHILQTGAWSQQNSASLKCQVYLCLNILYLWEADISAERRFFHLFPEGTKLNPQGVLQCYSLDGREMKRFKNKGCYSTSDKDRTPKTCLSALFWSVRLWRDTTETHTLPTHRHTTHIHLDSLHSNCITTESWRFPLAGFKATLKLTSASCSTNRWLWLANWVSCSLSSLLRSRPWLWWRSTSALRENKSAVSSASFCP